MRTWGLLLFAALAAAGPARAESPPECRVAQHLLETTFPLPRVAKALEDKQLRILVVGAGSSTLPGTGAAVAYPARLQHALEESLPGVTIKVSVDVKLGRTAPEALKAIVSDLAAFKPNLMIWQAGTIDAMRSIEVDNFSVTLDKGIDAAKIAGADVVLINAQYSPRTESIIALGTYLENMRWVALQHEIPLFDRFTIMKLWGELGVFDYNTATKKLDMAGRVHDCIGRLIGDLVVEAAKPAALSPGGGR